MSETGAITDEHGRIAVDLTCLHCSYNLRTCKADDACPECGAKVALSMRDRLQFADQAWLMGLVSGVNWLLVGVGIYGLYLVGAIIASFLGSRVMGWAVPFVGVLFVAVGLWWAIKKIKHNEARHVLYLLVAFVFIRIFFVPSQGLGVWPLSFSIWARLALIVRFGSSSDFAFTLIMVGMWKLSRRKPRYVPAPDERTARLWVRGGMIGLCVLGICSQLISMDVLLNHWASVLYGLYTAAWIAMIFGILGLARSIAQREGDTDLIRQCRIAFWGYAMSKAVTATIAMAMALGVGPPSGAMGTMIEISSGIFALLVYVFGIWALVIAVRLKRMIRGIVQAKPTH